MSKVVAVTVCGIVIAAAVAFWLWPEQAPNSEGTKGASTETSQEKPSANAPALSSDEASSLTTKMLSPNPTDFESVWATPVAGLPMPPSGTTLELHKATMQSYGVASHAKATLTMPGQQPSGVDVFFEYTTDKAGYKQWKLRAIK